MFCLENCVTSIFLSFIKTGTFQVAFSYAEIFYAQTTPWPFKINKGFPIIVNNQGNEM